jgi:hypothetical protein
MRGVGREHRHVADLRSALDADEVDRAEQTAGLADRLRETGERAGLVLEPDAQRRAEGSGWMCGAQTAASRS